MKTDCLACVQAHKISQLRGEMKWKVAGSEIGWEEAWASRRWKGKRGNVANNLTIFFLSSFVARVASGQLSRRLSQRDRSLLSFCRVSEHLPVLSLPFPPRRVRRSRAEKLFKTFGDLQTAAYKCFSVHLMKCGRSLPQSRDQIISPRASLPFFWIRHSSRTRKCSINVT